MAWMAIVGAGICEIFGVIGINGASTKKDGHTSYLCWCRLCSASRCCPTP